MKAFEKSPERPLNENRESRITRPWNNWSQKNDFSTTKQKGSRCILRSKKKFKIKKKCTGVQETHKIEVQDAQTPQDSARDHAIKKDKELEQKVKSQTKPTTTHVIMQIYTSSSSASRSSTPSNSSSSSTTLA